jgi:hypothetical protein
VEAFEDDILFGEIFPVACILEPVVGDRLVGICDPAVLDVVEPLIDPFVQERPKRATVI